MFKVFFAKNCRWTFFVEICERGERWAFLGCQVLPCPRHQHGQCDQRLSIAGHSTRTNLTKDHSRRPLISCAISIRPNILTFDEAIPVWKYKQEDASTVIKSIWSLFLQPIMWQCAPGNIANFSFSALQFNFVLDFLTFTLKWREQCKNLIFSILEITGVWRHKIQYTFCFEVLKNDPFPKHYCWSLGKLWMNLCFVKVANLC